MRKSVYDTNNDGIVDSADKVSGIENAGNKYYYGTNESGIKGFFPIPESEVDLSNYYNKTEVDALIPAVAFPNTESNTTITVGGLAANSTLANKTVLEVLRLMLKPFVNPNATITFISIRLVDEVNFAKSGLNFERGASVNQLIFSYSTSANSDTYLGAAITNTNLTQINLNSSTPSATVTCNFSTNIISTSDRVVTITTDWQTSANEIDTLTLIPVSPVYYGVGTVGQNVTTLSKANLSASKVRTLLPFNAANNRYIYAYPKSYGVLSSIIDNNGFQSFSSFVRTEQNVVFADGTNEDYYVYTINADRVAGAVTFSFS